MKIDLIQVFFFTVGLKKKSKNENRECYGTFMPFKSQLCSKPGSSTFLLFASWSLDYYRIFIPFICQLYSKLGSSTFFLFEPWSLVYLHAWVKSKIFR